MYQSYVNYMIVGEEAFTEDDILIQKIIVYITPNNTTVSTMSEYFNKFGEVSDVHLTDNNMYLVLFADSKSAAKALQIKEHNFLSDSIFVEACSSFDQPAGRILTKALDQRFETNFIINNNEQKALIFTLNDDCLEKICKNLDQMDQINFALTCQRFYDVLVMLSKVQYIKFCTSQINCMTLFKVRIFLQAVGPAIKALEINSLYSNGEKERQYLASFCTNVEELTINNWNQSVSQLITMIRGMPQLRKLRIDNICLNQILECLKTFKNLIALSFTNCDCKGANIHCLIDLEELSLEECYNITSQQFQKICENFKNLHYLDIRECRFLKIQDHKYYLKHPDKLKTLKISTNQIQNFNCITELPGLTHLEITSVFNTENFIEFLKRTKLSKLEELKVSGHIKLNLEMAATIAALTKLKVLHLKNEFNICEGVCGILSQLTELEEICFSISYFNNEDILKLLEKCLKLKHITFMGYGNLTPDILCKVVKLLQEQRARDLRTDCILMQHRGYKSDLNSEFYNPDVIKIISDTANYKDDSDEYDYDCGASGYPDSADECWRSDNIFSEYSYCRSSDWDDY